MTHRSHLALGGAMFGAALAFTVAADAAPLLDQGKLLLTGGVTNVEGAAGGGIATWATITGYGTNDGIGGNVHATYADVRDYRLTDYGAAVGLYNRVELSYARQDFDTRSVGPKLGLPQGYTFSQDVYGAKLRVIGDLVYDQDSLLPQISVGLQHKEESDKLHVIRSHAFGIRSTSGTDYYVAATKLFLDQSLLVNATVRYTKANQGGLLGFGGPKSNDYKPQFEGSVGYLLSKKLVVGAEYRTKPDNVGLKENDWYDLYAAYALNKHVSVTLAYANLGDIATFKNQDGVYLSLQAGF